MIAVVAVILFIIFMWLKFYTNHGQQLELPSYIDQKFQEAQKDAEDKTFDLIINDSIHVVGKSGGIILKQDPKPGALVKEKRKIYVDVTKYTADEYSLDKDIPTLYGQEFNRTQDKLRSLQLEAEIKSKRPDKGVENHILEVYYNNELIDGKQGKKPGVKISKGGKLEFVVSTSFGQSIEIPDWTCKRFGIVRTLARFNKINIGTVEKVGAITNQDSAFIVRQFPPVDPLSTMVTGQAIDVIIQQNRPDNCK